MFWTTPMPCSEWQTKPFKQPRRTLEEARRAMPVIIAVAVVTTAAVVGIYLWRRRSSDREKN